MKLNRLKRSKPVSIVKTVAPSRSPKAPTSEAVSLARRARVIERASQRIAQQRKTRLEGKTKSKVSTKTALPGISPRPPAISSTRKLPTVAPTEVAEPKLSPAAIRSLEFAVAAMERKDKTLSQRRLMAFHHLQKDPLTATLNPDQLLS